MIPQMQFPKGTTDIQNHRRTAAVSLPILICDIKQGMSESQNVRCLDSRAYTPTEKNVLLIE